MASVLIVDDQDLVRQMLRLAPESQGIEVRVAGDGDEALRLYREAPADVVVTDIVMPNKEGIETIFELRRSLQTRRSSQCREPGPSTSWTWRASSAPTMCCVSPSRCAST
jgi:CheY-like chemotaxis protein